MSLHADLAKLCWYAYDRPARARMRAWRIGWTIEASFDKGPAEAYLFRTKKNGGAASLTFRGTEASRLNIWDMLCNLGWGPWHIGYNVHLSFIYDEAREMAEQVASEIPLYVCGHSMGGALALRYVVRCNHKIAGVVTFGAPKAINRGERKHFKSWPQIASPNKYWNPIDGWRYSTTRYVNGYDFAEWLPPSLLLVHPTEATRVGGGFQPISDHWPARYARALENHETR